jgi:hypothetical protein
VTLLLLLLLLLRDSAAAAAALVGLTVLPPADNNLTGFIRPMTTCQMDCTLAGPDNKLAYPPYLIHNWFNDEARNASLDFKGIATNASKHRPGG